MITNHKILLFLTFTLLSFFQSFSQQNKEIDSLTSLLKSAKSDTQRCAVLNYLIEISGEKEWPVYNQQLSDICEKQLSKLDKKDPTRTTFLKYMATVHSNKGLVYENQGDVQNAMNYYHKSLKIHEEVNDRDGMSSTLFNLGGLYNNQENYPKALEFYEKSYKKSTEICKTCEEKQDKSGMAYALNNIATIYNHQGDTTKAMNNYKKALQLMEESGNKNGSSYVLNCIGSFYFDNKMLPQALEYYSKSKILIDELNDRYGMACSNNNIAGVLIDMGKINEAKPFAEKAFMYANELGFPNIIKFTSETMSKIHSRTCNWKGAFEMQVLFKRMSDTLLNEANRKSITQKTFQYEYEKKAAADSIKVVEERKVFDVQIKQEKTQRSALYVVLALIAVFSIFMYNRFRVTNKQKKLIEIKEKETLQQKHIIEEKHKEISDSINYAERIQRSFLATKDILDKNLNEYFVLFKPKDVVSGDFYWASELDKGKFAFATADSTGHGVPGAIMSLLNITSLEKAIEHHSNPAEILGHTRINIIDRLKKDGSEHGGKDGMDCSLLVFDFKTNIMEVAAAHNPVWIIRENELIEIKGDKMPVGKYDRDGEPFTLHHFELKTGDTIYTLTDGFPDQFGGPNGKKFMSKNLKAVILQHHSESMDKQKEKLEKAFLDWVGNTEQIDDVTLIGIRVG